MDVWLSVEGEDPVDGLMELSDWLGQEPGLRGLVAPPAVMADPGELGLLADVLVAAVGSGGALTVLAASLKAFLAQPQRSDIRIVLRTPDGRRLEVDAKGIDHAEVLVREMLGQIE